MLRLQHLFPALRHRPLLRRLLYLMVVAGICIAIVATTYKAYQQERLVSIPLDVTSTPQQFPQFLYLRGRLLTVDPTQSTFRLSMLTRMIQNPTVSANETGFFAVDHGIAFLTEPLTFFVQSTRINFILRDRINTVDSTPTFSQSQYGPQTYPFDHYTADFTVSAQYTNDTTMVPIQFQLAGNPPGFTLQEYNATTNTANGSISIRFTLRRSGTTIGFSIFVIFLSWVLSLMSGFLALQILSKKREVAPPLLSVPCALLFALPSLRNVQPNIPPVGVIADVLGFYWNMFIVALSAVTIILSYILRWKPPPSEVDAEAMIATAVKRLTATHSRFMPEQHMMATRTESIRMATDPKGQNAVALKPYKERRSSQLLFMDDPSCDTIYDTLPMHSNTVSRFYADTERYQHSESHHSVSRGHDHY